MNFSQNNQYSQQGNYYPNKGTKTSKELYPNTGYGSSGSSTQNNNTNYNFQNNINNSQNMNMQNNNNYPPQNYHYPIEQGKERERPLWSYREIKYDEFKEPLNTEELAPKKIERPEIQPEIPRQSNLDQLQEEDKKYFNNMKYQKVKVTKKVKNNVIPPPKVQKKGPVDDYEQQYNINNYDNNNNINEQVNNQNPEFMENQNYKINNYNYNNEKNEQNFENINNEDEEGEIELAQKDIQDEYDKIIDDNNEENYNNQNVNYNEEDPKQDIKDLQNQMQQNAINDDELQKENYDIDIENLAEANSDNEKEEKENIPQPQENYIQNENNNIQANQPMRPRPAFNEVMTQKVTDYIDEVKTFPEGTLESWNCVADYTPN